MKDETAKAWQIYILIALLTIVLSIVLSGFIIEDVFNHHKPIPCSTVDRPN